MLPALRTSTALLLVAVTAGCGSSNSNSGSSTSTSGSTTRSTSSQRGPSPQGGTLSVKETEFKIVPASPKIAKPGTVTLSIRDTGKFHHALEIEGPSGESRSDTVEPGESETLKVRFSKRGTYEWYCPIDHHRQKGMQGKVTVA